MCGACLSRMMNRMHTLNARVIAAQFVEDRIDSASRHRRIGRVRRRFTRGERGGSSSSSSSSPIPGRLRPSGAGR
jgi:hypothetical protein